MEMQGNAADAVDRRYRSHDVVSEHLPGGQILLRSGLAMSRPVANTTNWLMRWAIETPDAVFLAERSGDGWRRLGYGAALERTRSLAAGLLARMPVPRRPILILSGNSVNHGLLALAAQYVGIPFVPVAEQYALIPGAQAQLRHVLSLCDPGMVFAEDGATYASALALPEMAGRRIVVARNPAPGMSLLDDLDAPSAQAEAAHAQIGPDTVVKILMTSGSTSLPKGVITTQRMLCANQAMIADALPFVTQRRPRILDWLPWNHVFGGSHNFNLMLSNGGALYIDGGKPAPHLIGETIENSREISATMAFNVPVGYAQLVTAMRSDAALRRAYFRDLDMIFYAGASLPQDVWNALQELAQAELGRVPLMTTSWGLTETAPAAMIQHEQAGNPGIVGVPMTGTTVKLVPDGAGRFEVRVKGANVTPGYWNDAAKTADAFDDEGYFCTGDAMTFVDPADACRGMRFDGRIAEDFKLLTGTWVRAAALRLEILPLLAGLAMDVVLTGEGQSEVGLLVVPPPGSSGPETDGARIAPELAAQLRERLSGVADPARGSAACVVRALVLAEPPSMADGEITAKGNLNFRKITSLRADLVRRLYEGGAGVIHLGD